MRFLRNKAAFWLTVVLLAQGAAYYAVAARPELAPDIAPLQFFPAQLQGWRMLQDYPLEPEVADVLRADDTLNRLYVDNAGDEGIFFFIAYFKTQRHGAAPHSPKNCLPGSGWEPAEPPGVVSIPIAGAPPIVANHYVVERGEQRSVVVYWYQSHQRVIASEFAAKFWLVADAIRYRRSDTALLKVVVAVRNGRTDLATRTAVEFVQAAYPEITKRLPG